MAESIRGINVVIGAETTGLSKALTDVNKKSRDIQSELKQVEKLLKLDPTNTELLAQKQKLLGDAVANTRDKLERLKAAQQQVNEQFAKGEISEGQYRAFQRELAKTEQELNGFDGKLGDTNKTISKQSSLVEKLGNDYKESFDKVKSAGKAVTAFGAVVATGLGFAIKAASDAENQLAKMETAMQGNAEAAKEYLAWAKEFGKTTPFEASEVVDATIKLKSYGLEAKSVLTSIGNMAAGMGKGLDQAIEAVADAQTGELERLKEFGITKKMLIDQALKLGKGEIVNAKGQITDMKALNDALFSLMDERFKGGMERQSKTLSGQLSALKDTLTQIITAIGETLLPIVTQIVGFIQKLADGFGNLSPSMQSVIAVSGAIVAALSLIAGPMLLLIGFIPQIVAGFAALTPVTAALGTAFTALTGPIGIAIAAVAALVAGLVYLYNNNETVREGITRAWEAIKTTAEIVFNAVATFIKKVFDDLKQWWSEWGSTITGIFKDLFEILKIAFDAAFKLISDVVMRIFNELKTFWSIWGKTITGLFTTVLNVVKTVFQGVWNSIKIIIETVIGVISGIIKTFLAVLKGDWSGAWEAVKGVAESIWNGIKAMFSNVGSTMMTIGKEIMQGLINGIKNMANAVWDSAKDVAAGIKDGFKDFFGIHSPSRLMTDYGQYISQGLANGIAVAGRQAVKSAANVSAAVANAMQLDYSGVSMAANAALRGAAASNAGTNQTNVSFADMFRGANLTVRNDNDIKLIAQELGGVVTKNLRALGGA